MNRIFYGLIFPLYIPFFFLFVALSTVFFGTIVIILAFIPGLDPKRNIGNWIGRLWSWMNLGLSGTSVHMRGKYKIDREQSYVVMSNHQSHFDVWALIAYLPLQLRWVMKIELRSIPVFGYGCEKLGMIYVDRGDSARAHESLEAAKEKIKSGASVVFFPEGTRSPDGQIHEFKKGGFVMALGTGTPIVPITINGSRYALPKNMPLLMKPGHIEIIIHDPVEVSDLVYEDRDALMDKIRKIIEADLDLEYGRIV
jgi:1-acyl-sn-glycerol-3-phosphate acyltransferase